jgi:hypothetical protein
MPSTACALQADLIEGLNGARKLYALTVRALDDARPTQEIDVLEQVEAARLLYLKAREALVMHWEQHRCEVPE